MLPPSHSDPTAATQTRNIEIGHPFYYLFNTKIFPDQPVDQIVNRRWQHSTPNQVGTPTRRRGAPPIPKEIIKCRQSLMWPKDTRVWDPPVAFWERDSRWCTMTLGTRASTLLRLMNPSVSWARLQGHRGGRHHEMHKIKRNHPGVPQY